MRFVYFLLICAALAGCFFLGYRLGQQENPPEVVTVPPVEMTEEPAPSDETQADDPAETLEPPKPTPDERANYEMEARAARGVVDLTDQQGRTIRAMLLEAQADALKVRRQVDFTVVEIPVAMLSQEDQRFAEFLWNRRVADGSASSVAPASAEDSSQAMPDSSFEDEVTPELFDEIFGE
jgi:hypothetical protein